MNAREIIEILNATDELAHIEAKRGRKVSTSALETICAFANRPGVEVGYLIAGVARDDSGPDPVYTAVGVEDADQYQLDLASRCANDFNRPLRPGINVEVVDGVNVVVVKVRELSPDGKPLFFKSEGLPQGAYLRIGSSDQRCREEDLILFYGSQTGSYDATPVDYTSMDDIDVSALERYRVLRKRVKEDAEELLYMDRDLLRALHCMMSDGRLTVAGVHLFGTSACIRRTFPIFRVDYIRVRGNTWIEDPNDRFYSVDMRGPLLKLVYRAVDAVYDDLPKGFRLDEGDIQAKHIVLPIKVLREAIVNALMHRNYRIPSPIQLVRYENRVEIRSPGYSLKPEEDLGTIGSVIRNQRFATVFHETNLAETKGSGIRTMRRMLKEAHMAPPTFESSRKSNYFVTRLLLHHFLSEDDLAWLSRFNELKLSDSQKAALVFVRDVGAIDNARYRQLVDCKRHEAAADLRKLKEFGLVSQRGKTKNTYYVPTPSLISDGKSLTIDALPLTIDGEALTTDGKSLTSDGDSLTGDAQAEKFQSKRKQLSLDLIQQIGELGKRVKNKEVLEAMIIEVCQIDTWNKEELAQLFSRSPINMYQEYLRPMLKRGLLEHTIPDLIRHPNQAYRTPTTEDQDNA